MSLLTPRLLTMLAHNNSRPTGNRRPYKIIAILSADRDVSQGNKRQNSWVSLPTYQRARVIDLITPRTGASPLRVARLPILI